MSPHDHYLEIIYDYHNGQHTRSLTLDSKHKARALFEMLSGNHHIRNLNRTHTTITFDYA